MLMIVLLMIVKQTGLLMCVPTSNPIANPIARETLQNPFPPLSPIALVLVRFSASFANMLRTKVAEQLGSIGVGDTSKSSWLTL